MMWSFLTGYEARGDRTMRTTEISQSAWAKHCSRRMHRAVACCCVP